MTSYEPNVTERLQHALAQWQSLYFLYETLMELESKTKPVDPDYLKWSKNAHRLPEVILDNSVEILDPRHWFPLESMAGPLSKNPEDAGSDVLSSLRRYMSFPSELFMWNRMSRRVFHLPPGLQALLASASFPEIPWSDVLWPHDSFIITVEKPLVMIGDNGERDEYDTILVTKLPHELDGGHVSVRLLDKPSRDGVKVGYTTDDVMRIKTALKKGDYRRAVHTARRKSAQLDKIYNRMNGSTSCALEIRLRGSSMIALEAEEIFDLEFSGLHTPGTFIGEAVPEWDTLPRIEQARYEVMSVACRIAIGWALYLESLAAKPGSLEWSPPQKQKKQNRMGGATAVITQPDEICHIAGRGRIDPAEYGVSKDSCNNQGFIRPHWRRAHWRRPRGSPPNAPKTIKIPALLVRADLVPLYGIIGGTKTIVMEEG